MKFFKRIGVVGLIGVGCAILACIVSLLFLLGCNKLLQDGKFNFGTFIQMTIFAFIVIGLLCNIFISHKIATGETQEVIFFVSILLLISMLAGYLFYCLIFSSFNFTKLDWLGFFLEIISFNFTYWGIVLLLWILIVAFYFLVIDRDKIVFLTRGGLFAKGKLHQINANLENSRWMNDDERDKLFKHYKYSELSTIKKDGIPVMAKLSSKGNDMDVVFNSPCHSLIIGSTGSGKTTTFVSPMIQLIGASGAGSSMVMTDPKGELFSLHSKFLVSRGYDVKVIDLRDTYSSYRWNPLDSIYDSYTDYKFAYKKAKVERSDVAQSGLTITGKIENFANKKVWFSFDNKAYSDYDSLLVAVKLYKKKVFDEIYEDLNDLVSVLIPVENEKDPMWEKGARAITLAVLLAMLEDSEDETLGMTKEKFNFFNMTKILQNSSDDYADLKKYFVGRSPLSKAKSLSKQVCDAATQTRASYMSIVYEKLTMFNDAGICALTSSSDFTAEGLAQRPTALFLKIPDEKDTRHNLAAIFILNIYKTLIKVASATEELTLDRNVFFIMDEFGNMPKIEKFDKFITVGRSRKIWFNMIVQSYAQLNNVYGETVADIVKGNCGIKMFIGSNDMNTCKEYSELCGNITVVTTSTSGSASSSDVNLSQQTQVRPLIYPSELQRLNAPGDIGHSIVVTFGNYPLKTYFSPSFKVPFYKMGKMDTGELNERFFDEDAVFYDISIRNNKLDEDDSSGSAGGGVQVDQQGKKEQKSSQSQEQPQSEEREGAIDENVVLKLLVENKILSDNAKIKDVYKLIDKMSVSTQKNNEGEVNNEN